MTAAAGGSASGLPGADDARAGERLVLCLYLAGHTPISARAVVNTRRFCEEQLHGRYELEIVDISTHPGRVRDAQIVAVPTLVKLSPLPVQRVIGDMSHTETPPAPFRRRHPAMSEVEARLRAEVEALRSQLQETEETLTAIRSGQVDAVVIGEQVYTLESADASSNLLRKDVLAQMEDAVVARDEEGHLIYLNPAAEARYGGDASSALGRPVGDLFVEQWPSVAEEAAAADAVRRTGVARSRTVHRKRDGSTLNAETTTSRLRDSSGLPIGYLAVIRDVTERERNDAALRESRAHLRFMLDSAGVGDWDLDLSTFAARHSLRHDQCFGYDEPVAAWNPEIFLSHVHPDDRPDVEARFRTSLETGADWNFECRVRWPDASIHWIGVHGAFYRDGGETKHMLGTIVDATARKSVEEALRTADRSKDEFLATLAHELRNPLAPIRTAIEIMRMTQDSSVQENARNVVERQLKQMVHLVDDLLDVSRITQGKVDLRLDRLDVLVVLQNAVETSRPLIETRRHHLALRMPPPGMLVLRGDATRLVQVVANLLNNAAKYTPEGGTITLSAEREGTHALIVVEDTGIGIPRDMLPRVFDMFAQIDRSTARSQGGLGIGLTLVEKLVELHGGSVDAESEGENRGSRFVVRLPLDARAPDAPADVGARPVAADGASGKRVLIVDDNVDNAITLSTMFELLGCATATAHDGHAAVREAERFQPDLAVLDIGMPGQSGHDAARQIRAQPWGRRMTLVALSGWGQDSDRRKSEQAGFDRHLVKPVDVAELQGMLAGSGSAGVS